jgi:hypothetical protein
VELNPAYRDYAERTEKVDLILRDMRNRGLFPAALKGTCTFNIDFIYSLFLLVISIHIMLFSFASKLNINEDFSVSFFSFNMTK